MNKFNFLTQAHLEIEKAEKINRILNAAIEAVDPYNVVHNAIKRENANLIIKNFRIDLRNIEHVYVVGGGKASAPMANALEDILGDFITKGIVVVKNYPSNIDNPSLHRIQRIPASHPIPDTSCVTATKEIIKLLDQTTKNDLVLFLISGGGSSLLTAPYPHISLNDVQSMTNTLLGSGATIHEINTLRKHLSLIKGGGLAKLAYPSRIISLILSDVVGDQIDVIASGPTAPDPTTYKDCISILEKYRLLNKIPSSIRSFLEDGARGANPETLKPHDPILKNVINLIIGSNYLAASGAKKQAKIEGLNTLLLSTQVQGEAKEIGKFIAAIARQVSLNNEPLPRPACIICGGETTVSLDDNNGYGGRNTELALSTVSLIKNIKDTAIVALATDGIDGVTDAAGAIVTGSTYARAQKLGLDPQTFLRDHTSYNFFAPLGNLLKPGPTQTNVNDLTFIFSF